MGDVGTVSRVTLAIAAVFLVAGCPRGSGAPSPLGGASPRGASPVPLEQKKPRSWRRESVHPLRFDVPAELGPLDPLATIVASTDDGSTYTDVADVPTSEGYYRFTVPPRGERLVVAVEYRATRGGVPALVRRDELARVELAPSTKRAYVWSKVTASAAFGPRDGAGGIVHGGKMWLVGGWNPSRFPAQTANDVWSSTDGATWRLVKPNTFFGKERHRGKADWEGRHFAGYHAFRGKMWIVGGDANQGFYQTDVWCSADGREWTRTDLHTTTPRVDKATGTAFETSVWPAVEVAEYGMRTAHVTGILHDRLFVLGGQRVASMVDPEWPGAPPAALDDVWVSNDGAGFSEVHRDGPRWSGRGFVSKAVTHAGRLWLVGGGLHDDPPAGQPERTFENEVWSTEDGALWKRSAEEPPFSPRVWHDVEAFDGRLWVVNGYDGPNPGKGRQADNLRDVWTSTDGESWYDTSPPSDFVPRHAGTTWVHDGALFVGAGNAFRGKTWVADVWKCAPRDP